MFSFLPSLLTPDSIFVFNSVTEWEPSEYTVPHLRTQKRQNPWSMLFLFCQLYLWSYMCCGALQDLRWRKIDFPEFQVVCYQGMSWNRSKDCKGQPCLWLKKCPWNLRAGSTGQCKCLRIWHNGTTVDELRLIQNKCQSGILHDCTCN